jgi:hypothetical protein
MRPPTALARRIAIAVGVALAVAGGWWYLRGPAIERHAVAPPPDIDIDLPAMRAQRDAAIALATLPDDPWSLAESLAASASAAASEPDREREDCGIADGPQFARTDSSDAAPPLTRGAGVRWLAAQARVDAALRASADPLDRVTADFVDAVDVLADGGHANAVIQQAALSSDPRVVALGHALCERERRSDAACAALSAQRWSQVDPGNGMPWIELLGQAQARGDEVGVREAMAHLATATTFAMRLYGPAGAIAQRLPADSRDLAAASDLMTRSIGEAAALPMPAFRPLMDVCRNEAGGDEARARQCRAISDTLYAHSDEMIPFMLSGRLWEQTTGDPARRDSIRAEVAVAHAHWSPGTGLAPCRDMRDQIRRTDRLARVGAVEAMREESRKFVPP